MNYLYRLVSSKIVKIEKSFVDGVFDYWKFHFDICYAAIYNPVKFFKHQGPIENVERIEDCKIENVIYFDNEYLIFEMENAFRIEISLRYEDYSGPEAAIFNFNSGEIIVINESPISKVKGVNSNQT